MFSKVLGALTIVRHAVAITLVTGAATAMVAGSVDVAGSRATANVTSTMTGTTAASTKNTTSGDLDAAIKACLATKDRQSLECNTALDMSGLSNEDFWAKLAFSLNEQVTRSKTTDKAEPRITPSRSPMSASPKPETAKPHDDGKTGELIGLVTACVASHERSSEPCAKALELSGLAPEDFWAKVTATFGHGDAKTEPSHTPKPQTAKATDESITQAIKECLARFEAYRNGATTEPISTSEVCRKAYEASGLTPEQFWAKFGPKPSTTQTPQPTGTAKPTTKPDGTLSVTTAQLEVLVKDCFAKYLIAKETHEGGTAASEACSKAITASGLGADAFFKKFGYPGAATN